jgi:hypothetical protein
MYLSQNYECWADITFFIYLFDFGFKIGFKNWVGSYFIFVLFFPFKISNKDIKK